MAVFTIGNAKELGAAIRERRTVLGLDQATLAKSVGVSRQWIIDIEKGKERASVELALRTLNRLGFQFAVAEGTNELKDPLDEIDFDRGGF